MDDLARFREAAAAAAKALNQMNEIFRSKCGSCRRDLQRIQTFLYELHTHACRGELWLAHRQRFVSKPKTRKPRLHSRAVKSARRKGGKKGGRAKGGDKEKAAQRNGDYKWKQYLESKAEALGTTVEKISLDEAERRERGELVFPRKSGKPSFWPRYRRRRQTRGDERPSA